MIRRQSTYPLLLVFIYLLPLLLLLDDTIDLVVAVDRSISWLSIDLSLLAVDRSL
jgi:hypothetical protein